MNLVNKYRGDLVLKKAKYIQGLCVEFNDDTDFYEVYGKDNIPDDYEFTHYSINYSTSWCSYYDDLYDYNKALLNADERGGDCIIAVVLGIPWETYESVAINIYNGYYYPDPDNCYMRFRTKEDCENFIRYLGGEIPTYNLIEEDEIC